jgi:hypothetical protein
MKRFFVLLVALSNFSAFAIDKLNEGKNPPKEYPCPGKW